MVRLHSKIRLVALVLALGVAGSIVGCKTTRNSTPTGCAPTNCCAPTSCAPAPCQQACPAQANACGDAGRVRATSGNCDCAPHNPLDPYRRHGMVTTVPTQVQVVTPPVTTSPALPSGPLGYPAITNPIIGSPLPVITQPEPMKDMGMKDMGMKKEK